MTSRPCRSLTVRLRHDDQKQEEPTAVYSSCNALRLQLFNCRLPHKAAFESPVLFVLNSRGVSVTPIVFHPVVHFVQPSTLALVLRSWRNCKSKFTPENGIPAPACGCHSPVQPLRQSMSCLAALAWSVLLRFLWSWVLVVAKADD